jgi:hypothetical protein
VSGQERRGIFEPFDEQSADVIRRVINWPDDLVAAFGAEPFCGRFEERRRDRRVVNRLEKTEATDIGAMIGIIVWIITGHDPANDFSPAAGKKQRSIAMLVERVLSSIEKLFALDQEWGHPSWIKAIDFPGKLDEGITLRLGADLVDLYRRHRESIFGLDFEMRDFVIQPMIL